MGAPDAAAVGAGRRIWAACLGTVAAAGVATAAVAVASDSSVRPFVVIIFFLLFLVSERTFLQFETRRQAYHLSANEIPLVLALFYLPPIWVIIARVAAALVIYAFTVAPVKALFNVANRGLSTAAACLVILPFIPLNVDRPSTWAVLIGAAEVGNLLSLIVTSAILGVAQGWMGTDDFLRLAQSSFLMATLNSIIGLLVLFALSVSLWTLVPLAALGAVIAAGYRAYSRSLQHHRSLAELYEFTQAAGPARQEGNLADVLLVRTRKLLNAEYATLWLPASGRHPALLLTARIEGRGLTDRPATPDELRAQAVASDSTVVVSPKRGDPDLRAALAEYRRKDAIVVPLRSGTAVIGTIEVCNRVGDLGQFGTDDVRLLETLAAHIAVAVENSRLVDRLRFDAYHDSLTGLPNRRRLVAALEDAVKVQAPGEVVAVLMFDVDGLRDVNDSLGHLAGDKLLSEVARRLRALAPPSALVTRVGGDEFGVLLRIGGGREALDLAGRLRTSLQEPFTLGTLTLDVDAAVGVALHPEDGTEAETLLQRADLAMYAAKQTSSHVQQFTLTLESRSVRRMGLAGDLRRALDANELEVYFQPKVAIADRRLVGVECLARWEHPAHGSVAPDDFIAVAEHTGQLGRLTEVVLREGLRRCREWADEGRPLTVAVNLSPRTLVDPEFPGQVAALLDEYGVPAERLTLEITEDGMVGGTDRPMPTLARLHELGVRLSVDDFGTGFSSLSYLRRLPVQEVKVDRTFVQGMATDPRDLAIVRAVVDLSRHFGYSVVAEGVESELTLSLLEAMGCEIGQGFFFSRPLPYARLETWFAAQTVTESAPDGDVRRLRAVR